MGPSEALQRYRQLRATLAQVRASHGDLDSEEEDAVLDEMDDVWWKMTPDEHAQLDAE